MSDTQEDNLDDFMDSIGLNVKPTGPEDALMIKLNGGAGSAGGYKEIYNFRYWLRHELYGYYDLVKHGCMMFQSGIEKNAQGDVISAHKHKPFTKLDYVKVRTKYYLNMKYNPWFTHDVSGLGKANIDQVCNLVLEHSAIKSIVECEEKDLPLNNSY